MESNYKNLISLQKEINDLFKEIESLKIKDVDRLIMIQQLLKHFKQSELNAIDKLFDVNENAEIVNIIKKLQPMKAFLKLMIIIENNINEENTTGSGGSFTGGTGEQFASNKPFLRLKKKL